MRFILYPFPISYMWHVQPHFYQSQSFLFLHSFIFCIGHFVLRNAVDPLFEAEKHTVYMCVNVYGVLAEIDFNY